MNKKIRKTILQIVHNGGASHIGSALSLVEILGKNVKIIETNPTVISIRNPSNYKAKKLINWNQKINLKKGLKTLMDV